MTLATHLLWDVFIPFGVIVFSCVFALLWPAKWDPAIKLKEWNERDG